MSAQYSRGFIPKPVPEYTIPKTTSIDVVAISPAVHWPARHGPILTLDRQFVPTLVTISAKPEQSRRAFGQTDADMDPDTELDLKQRWVPKTCSRSKEQEPKPESTRFPAT